MNCLHDKKTAALYCKLKTFQFLLNKTNKFIEWSLKQIKNPYVACSFGKDSSVMLHLVLQYMPNIPVIWITFPETAFLNNYYTVVEQWKQQYKINLHEIKIDIPADQPFDDTEAFPKVPYDSYLIGITKEESAGRRITLKKYGRFHKKKDNMIRIAPLADWKINDIAAYCLANDLPILDSYKIEGFKSRTVTGFTENMYAFRLNQLSELKNRDIQAFNLMLSKWPGLKNYV